MRTDRLEIAAGFFGLAALLLAGCSGGIWVPERCTKVGCACTQPDDCGGGLSCIDNQCRSNRCSPTNPAGTCPEGRVCVAGVCAPPGWCDCDPSEGCNNEGDCIPYDDSNMCSPALLNGLCEVGSTCVAGVCQVITADNTCSPERPNGLCPPGSGCDGGYCIPLGDDPCSRDNPTGLCAGGMLCVPPGVCSLPACSPEVTFGFCDAGLYCSKVGRCITLGWCLVNEDCEDRYICDEVDAICERDPICTQDEDCLTGEHCSVASLCMLIGQCTATEDCNLDEICAVSGRCLQAGFCEVDQDCLGGKTCSSLGTCIDPGSCATVADCPPAHTCVGNACVSAGELCTINVATPADCPSGEGETCCDEGQRCSLPSGVCIYDGQCITDADCLAGSFTCGDDYRCVPASPCVSGTDCTGVGEICSYAGGCIPDGSCVTDADCDDAAKVCNALYECVVGANCGDNVFDTTFVKPNMLIVLDKSGSMAWELGSTGDVRWDVAEEAVNAVVAANAGKIRFGLTVYPNGSSCQVGIGNVPVQDITVTDPDPPATVPVTPISQFLANVNPVGSTPTGPTLRSVRDKLGVGAAQGGFDFPTPGDIPRGNYVLLVTDGEAKCEYIPNLSENVASARRANGAIKLLKDAGVTTYVVGIALSSANLNCNAVYGGTARADCTLTATTCSGDPLACQCSTSSSPLCYYKADDRAQLDAAFSQIVGQVASCSFSLSAIPPDLQRLYVYLKNTETQALTPIVRDDPNGYSYSPPPTNQILLLGTACDQVKNSGGGFAPHVIYGCAPSGG